MADITALLAGAAKTNANFDFGELPKAYWGGLEEAYKRRTRDAFQDPSLYDAQGNIDPAKAISTALRAGGIGAATEAKSLFETGALQQRQSNTAGAYRQQYGGGGDTREPPVAAPPSMSQSGAKAQAAPDLTQPKARPQAQAGPFTEFLTAQGVPPEQHGPASAALQQDMVKLTGKPFDTSKPINMNDGNVRDVLKNFALKNAMARQQQAPQQAAAAPPPQAAPLATPPPVPGAPGMGPGGAQAAIPPQAAPQAAPPPPQAAPPQAAAQQPIQPRAVRTEAINAPPASVLNTPDLGGVLTPAEVQQFGTWQRAADFYARVLRAPGGLEAGPTAEYAHRLQAIRSAVQSAATQTDDQKKAAASGMSLPQYLASEEKKKADTTLMDKVDVPTVTDSKAKASPASEEIKVYHEAKEVMNQPGGIIAGAGGDQLLAMAKVAGKYLGIPAAEQAANRTEAFRAIMSGGVLTTVKQLGAGAGITNADVKFASDMVGKNITLDENSIRRIISLAEKVARRKIADHNTLVDRVVAANPMLADRASIWRVEPPPLRIRVSNTPQVGDVRKGLEYYGGDPNNRSSWSEDKVDGPDTLRRP